MPPRKKTLSAQQEQDGGAYIIDDLYKAFEPTDDKYQQKGGVFKHPARVMIAAPSGSGKTNLAGNLALNHFVWDTISIFAKNTEQPVFDLLKNYIAKNLAKSGGSIEDQFHISNEIDRKPQDYDQNLQHLVIIDDLTHKDSKKEGSLAAQFFKYGRPNNISTIVITQNFFDCAKQVRENVNYYIAFRGRDPQDINKMRQFYATDVTREQFDKLYETATKKENVNDRNCFLTIVVDETEPGKKFRRGLVPYSLIPPEHSVPEAKPKLKVRPSKPLPGGGFRSSHGPSYSPPFESDDDDDYDTDDERPPARFKPSPSYSFPGREMVRRI